MSTHSCVVHFLSALNYNSLSVQISALPHSEVLPPS